VGKCGVDALLQIIRIRYVKKIGFGDFRHPTLVKFRTKQNACLNILDQISSKVQAIIMEKTIKYSIFKPGITLKYAKARSVLYIFDPVHM